MINQNFKIIAALMSLLLCAGCSTMTGGSGQNVSVQTYDTNGTEVSGAVCDMSNNKGKWFVTTPGSTGITRSNDNLAVVCKKENYEPGTASVVSATKGSMFGNIILGGGIGAIVDHNNGSAYEYPIFFKVMMGTSTVIDETKKKSQTEANGAGDSNGLSSDKPLQAKVDAAPVPVKNSMVTNNDSAVDRQAKDDAYKKLEKLKGLSDRGVITQEEYNKKKKEILDSM